MELETNKKSLRKHTPFLRIVKRGACPMWRSVSVRIITIIVALIFCAGLSYIVIKADPISLYEAMYKGSFGSKRKLWKLAKDIAILLSISLAVTPAFKMKFWNIGAEGQVLVSALASAAASFYLGGKVSEWMLLVIMFAGSVLAGTVWAAFPAVFKAKWNTNETLFTLMMNYIATFLVSYFLITWTVSRNLTSLGELPFGHLPKVYHAYFLIILTVAVLTIFMHIYLNYSKHGYEISVVGESEKTAKYIGINVKKIIVRTMMFSGAICGIIGFLIVGALDHTVTEVSVGGLGFTAIMVSWLAKFKPFNMVLTSFLLVFLTQGSAQVSQNFNISESFPNVIVGIILFFIIGCEFFIDYKLVFRKNKKEANQ